MVHESIRTFAETFYGYIMCQTFRNFISTVMKPGNRVNEQFSFSGFTYVIQCKYFREKRIWIATVLHTTTGKFTIRKVILYIENSDDQDTIVSGCLPVFLRIRMRPMDAIHVYYAYIHNSSDARYLGARRLSASAADIAILTYFFAQSIICRLGHAYRS